MTNLVLVTYATQHGSTREVAQAIAATLEEKGFQVELRPVNEVRKLNRYSAIVLGAPFYFGRWHGQAHRFLRQQSALLEERPVALFALGPLHPVEQEWNEVRAQLDRIVEKAVFLKPVAVEVFGGVITPEKLHFPLNKMPAGDARDWTIIRNWAEKVASLFQSTALPDEKRLSDHAALM